ncbi:MAG: polysaccharide pyruvyl transferase family protein, partial [Euryarchaeota archaeon]|nr:polysaccharide pyruvyl transferase family protein [Euryarchaeota archaeon]
KPSIAYAVDAGGLSEANKRRVCCEGSKTDLIALRTNAAADRLRSCGVTAPIIVTGDTAFTFRTSTEDDGLMARIWPEASSGVVGLAIVDFNIWPVVIRPWGGRSRRYRWPYYFSSSRARRGRTEELARGYAAEADRIVERWGRSIALIAMEALPDEPLATRIKDQMKHSDRARIFSSVGYNASQMTSILRSLDLLITSRYHAGVLSLAANVPQIAVAHDYRLRDFYADIGLKEEYLIEHDSPDLWKRLSDRVDRLMTDPEPTRAFLHSRHEEQVSRARLNHSVLRAFLKERGWEVIG